MPDAVCEATRHPSTVPRDNNITSINNGSTHFNINKNCALNAIDDTVKVIRMSSVYSKLRIEHHFFNKFCCNPETYLRFLTK